ncbi:hypothetical protein LOZ80_09700 [Paenibacillus sp. HWE-109]|uniref:hypothetical protein n=1 Tax=Paenibacillus sp. HWE-109 TaxID=1306526 RepID=UPI001EDEE440|nr:hypothetical protein [Paenibacillus sp. HWE-109]UKS29181.1 hypothetical protein LOZ80_09700 [Paenibacillus sp. HWE-109]
MEERIVVAKGLFTLYRGHFIQMHRDGVLEDYRDCGIERQTEIEWYQELIAKLSLDLSIRDWDAVSSLEALAKYYQDERMLESVMNFITRQIMGADSIVKLMYAERLISLIVSLRPVITQENRYSAYQQALRILEDILAKPLVIDPGHDLHHYHLKDKKSLNLRAQKSIDEIMLLRF